MSTPRNFYEISGLFVLLRPKRQFLLQNSTDVRVPRNSSTTRLHPFREQHPFPQPQLLQFLKHLLQPNLTAGGGHAFPPWQTFCKWFLQQNFWRRDKVEEQVDSLMSETLLGDSWQIMLTWLFLWKLYILSFLRSDIWPPIFKMTLRYPDQKPFT